LFWIAWCRWDGLQDAGRLLVASVTATCGLALFLGYYFAQISIDDWNKLEVNRQGELPSLCVVESFMLDDSRLCGVLSALEQATKYDILTTKITTNSPCCITT